MHLKITGLKVDTGEEASPKQMAKAANIEAMKIEQETDPEKKKRLIEKAKGDDYTGLLNSAKGEGKKAEKKHKKRQKGAKGGAADQASGTVGGSGSGGNASGNGE